jgi:hypothetical protein
LAGTVERKFDSAVVLSPFPQSDEMLVGNMTLCPAAAGNDVATMLTAPINAMLRHPMSTHFVRVTSRLLIATLLTITIGTSFPLHGHFAQKRVECHINKRF